jgi:hypothetical protein
MYSCDFSTFLSTMTSDTDVSLVLFYVEPGARRPCHDNLPKFFSPQKSATDKTRAFIVKCLEEKADGELVTSAASKQRRTARFGERRSASKAKQRRGTY